MEAITERDKNNQIIIEHWFRIAVNDEFVTDLVLIMVEFAKFFERFDAKATHNRLIIENEGLSVKSNKSTFTTEEKYSWFTAIGTFIAKPGGIYTWKCKLVKGKNICIGILPNDYAKSHSEFWWWGIHEHQGYALYTKEIGNKNTGKAQFDPGRIKYAEQYLEGDIITICLDLKQYQISFGRNDIDYGAVPVVDGLKREKDYRFAVAFYGSNVPNVVEILSLDERY